MKSLIDILIIIILLAFSFIVVAAEIGILQIKRSDIPANKPYIEKMIDNKNEFMSTTQVGITLASMLAGWAGEPAMTNLFLLTGIQHLIGEKIISISAFLLITYLSIVFSELLPKNIAMAYPTKTLIKITPVIKIIHTIFYPMVWILDKSSTFITKALRIPINPDNDLLNESSLIKSMQIAALNENSDIKHADVKYIKNTLKLNDTPVSAIMVPIEKISRDKKLFSRTPSLDFKTYSYSDNIFELKSISKNKTADQVLDLMTKYHTSILSVKNNNQIIGIVTNTDIFEIIYPELYDEKTTEQNN